MIINAYHLGWLQPFIVWKLEHQPNISSTGLLQGSARSTSFEPLRLAPCRKCTRSAPVGRVLDILGQAENVKEYDAAEHYKLDVFMCRRASCCWMCH